MVKRRKQARPTIQTADFSTQRRQDAKAQGKQESSARLRALAPWR